jgi:hypothetical protein
MHDSLLVLLGNLLRSRWRYFAIKSCRNYILWRTRTLPGKERDEIRAALLADFDFEFSLVGKLKVAIGTSYLSALTPPDIQDRRQKTLDYEVPECDD